MQAAYDDGSLLETVVPGPLPAPVLLAPDDGAVLEGDALTVQWEPVAGATSYVVEVSSVIEGAPFFRSAVTAATSVALGEGFFPPNTPATYTLRVRADGPGLVGTYATRMITFNLYVPDFLDNGASIIEVASPAAPPCPDPADFGCDRYDGEGNTVWHDTTGGAAPDYYLSGGGGIAAGGSLSQLKLNGFAAAGPPDDFEMRFTNTGGYGVYYFGGTTIAGRNRVVRVPFELWNVGTTPDDPADDVRMVPLLRPQVTTAFVTDWANQFTGPDEWPEQRTTPTTEEVYFAMPDRTDGYARFEQAALGFGGAGALYDPLTDGDTENAGCANGGYYVDFCYRGAAPAGQVAPVSRLVIADLARDGTTPPEGTTIRLKTAKRLLPVDAEPDAPDVPTAAALRPPFPNPFAGRATLRYDVVSSGPVRLDVYDVLGRRVAVLAAGHRAAGTYEATLDGGRLAPGVYLVVLEAGEARSVRHITHIR